ncbi:type II toxin-antitoxin system RelB/DinJ family antitoxin [Thermophilibacter sp.]
MAELTAQMNIRMERGLKERGDAAIASLGRTPSELVRALWEKVARRGKDLEEVADLLWGRPDAAPSAHDSEKDPVLRGPHIVEEGMRELGINMSKVHLPELSYEELKELAWQDRLEERGLL